MGIVSGIPERCKRCYTCVRECPAKAIKVEKGEAQVIEERCVACGNCVKVCAQAAKRIEDNTQDVWCMFEEDARVIVCIAPSFPAAFEKTSPKRIVAALRRLGFDEVWSVAFGAELVSREYRLLHEASLETKTPVITSPCPAMVSYIEKYMPELRSMLAPIVSPMIATARAIRHKYAGESLRIVFAGPCIAKKKEIRDPFVSDTVDCVLTFKELDTMFRQAGIDPEELEEVEFDSPSCVTGWSFPLPSGILKTSGIGMDILDPDVLSTEGKDRVLEVLKEVSSGASRALFIDLLFCEGCISGPKMLNELGAQSRKEILAGFIKQQAEATSETSVESALDEYMDIDLLRGFSEQSLVLAQPGEAAIAKALRSMGKLSLDDHLNCGACGYPTCREKAIAVCQGLAEATMCLPYLVERLEITCQELQDSHQQLAATQQRLVQSERLASMGQLSAGVAHEINNPLGTVLIYSHMLLKKMTGEDPGRADLEMIVREAVRCKNIVRGLLDFARQSRVSKTPTDIITMFNDIMAIMGPRAETAQMRLVCEVAPDVPMMLIDGEQIKQMLLNLIKNAIEASPPETGFVAMRAVLDDTGKHVKFTVSDNGCGIAPEHLSRLFTPFFTTKEMGKGTGLGLAIAYGIVKMHHGDIGVESEPGKKTTFTITLPVGSERSAGLFFGG